MLGNRWNTWWISQSAARKLHRWARAQHPSSPWPAPCLHQMFFRRVWPLLQMWVPRPMFPFTCALPAASREQPSRAAAGHEQESWAVSLWAPWQEQWKNLQVWETSQGNWDGVCSQELGSLSTHPGRLFAELMHITELGVWAEEGREEERVV